MTRRPPCRGSPPAPAPLGLVLTYYLLGASQRAWPLVTSGMPIVPNWTNLIIIFEMTMLSAIIATVITLLVSAGIPSRGGKMYDPEVSDGYILVGVENPSDAARLEPALAIDGGRVKTTTLDLQFQTRTMRVLGAGRR